MLDAARRAAGPTWRGRGAGLTVPTSSIWIGVHSLGGAIARTLAEEYAVVGAVLLPISSLP